MPAESAGADGAVDAFIGEQQRPADSAGLAQRLKHRLPVAVVWKVDELVERGDDEAVLASDAKPL